MVLVKIGLTFAVICKKGYRFIIKKIVKNIYLTEEVWINRFGNLLISGCYFVGIG